MWYAKAPNLAIKFIVDEREPREDGRQINRSHFTAESGSDYFKKTITTPLAGHLHSELKSRFDLTSTNVFHGLYIVPTKMILVTIISWRIKLEREIFIIFVLVYLDNLPNPLVLL